LALLLGEFHFFTQRHAAAVRVVAALAILHRLLRGVHHLLLHALLRLAHLFAEFGHVREGLLHAGELLVSHFVARFLQLARSFFGSTAHFFRRHVAAQAFARFVHRADCAFHAALQFALRNLFAVLLAFTVLARLLAGLTLRTLLSLLAL